MHYTTRLWVCTPRHLARQVGEALAGLSSSLAHLHGSGGGALPPRRRRGDDGWCGVIRATRLSPSCARGNRARGAATIGSGARCTSVRVRAPVKGPSQAASGGALAAARELLRNPPATVASPDALRQWRDDVDRLLHLAQASPSSARTGQRPPPGNAVVPYHRRQGGASASVRSPTVRGARTEDLRAELN